MNNNRFFTNSLNPEYNWTNKIIPILEAALEAVEPAKAVNSYLHRQENWLIVDNIEYNLPDYERVFLIGVGKAAIPMSHAAAEILGDNLTEGIILVKEQNNSIIPPCQILIGGHPIPDINSIESTEKIIQLLEKTT
jgi:glycerate 2-kinase